MRKVEIIGRIPIVPDPLIEAIENADPKSAMCLGEECVANNSLTRAESNVIVGLACLAKASKIAQEIEESLTPRAVLPVGLLLDLNNLNRWGLILLQDSLPSLRK